MPNDAVSHKGFRLTGRLLLLYCRDRDGLCGRSLCKRWRFYQPRHHVLMTSVCLSTQQLFVFVSNCWVYIVIVPNCLISYPRGRGGGRNTTVTCAQSTSKGRCILSWSQCSCCYGYSWFQVVCPIVESKNQTDQLNASYTETSPSVANLIVQFGFPVFHDRPPTWNQLYFHPPCDPHCLYT